MSFLSALAHSTTGRALEGRSVELGENVAEVIVGRCTVLEGAKAAQEVELLLAEEGDVDEAVGPGEYREQRQQQDLGQRILDFPTLAPIVQILEI